ncbi:hypothetical protein RESH_02240 [Rhodopirellula europaea SH398]|uniref:Uncharacterized protein n=1 Tax=Rhodopirellula europaea SH398 TaxID=1263868 RepID=M5S6G8_9BACT|nr:hypothetical protein RESH_02240 [Rhodopirellula europaea SH398]
MRQTIAVAVLLGQRYKPWARRVRLTRRSHFGSQSKRHVRRIGIQLVDPVPSVLPAEA